MKENSSFRIPLLVLFICLALLLLLYPGKPITLESFLPLFRTLIPVCFIIWLVALTTLLGRRDIDIHDKLSWVVVILLLNGIGGLFYFLWGPPRAPAVDEDVRIPDKGQPLNLTGTSWNPFIGENRGVPGEGLNPPPLAADEESGTEQD